MNHGLRLNWWAGMRGGAGRARRRWGPLVATSVGVLAVLAAGGIIGLRVRSLVDGEIAEATLGRNELLGGAQIVKQAGLAITPAQAVAADKQFQLAESHFSGVHRVLTQSRSMRLAGSLPWIQTQVTAAAQLSDMGTHLATLGQQLIGVETVVVAADEKGSGKSSGERILDTLNAIDPKLSDLTGELDAAVADRRGIPSMGLLPQLSKAVEELDKKVNLPQMKSALDTIRTDEPGIRALLGTNGSRTYLVLNQDPAELRATGGFIGTIGFLTFDHGKMGPFNPVNIDSIDKEANGVTDILGGPGTSTHVDPPAPMESVFHLQSWELRDANWSPDFPTAAREAEFLLNRERGRRVDGVIALDPFLIQRLLGLIGPIKVGVTGDVVDENNFYAVTLVRRELGAGAQRNNFLPMASKQILTAVLSLPSSKWPALLKALQSACDGRSLQAYFHDAAAEALSNGHDCGGEVKPTTHDSLMIVETNIGGNKDDFWLKRQYSLKIAVGPNGTLRHTLKIRYYGLVSHGVALTRYWGYTGWLRIYLPGATSIVSVDGARLSSATDLGHFVVQGWFYVQFDHTVNVTISYDEPAAISGLQNGLQLFWQKQAGRLADPITVDLVPPISAKLRLALVDNDPISGGPVKSDLSVDRLFSFKYASG